MGRAAALGASSAAISTHAGERRRLRRGNAAGRAASLRLGLAGGSTTDSIDVGSYTDSVMIDVGHGALQRPRRMGPGRQADAGAGRELRAEERTPRTGSSTCARASSSRNGKEFNADDAIYSLNLHRGDTKSGAAGPMKASLRHQEARQVPDPDVARVAPTPISPTALTDYHLLMVPERLQGLGQAGRHRRAHAREVRSRACASSLKKQPDYWKEGRGHARRGRDHRDQRRLRAPQRADLRADRRHQPRRSKAVALLSKTPKIEARARARRLAHDLGDADRQATPTTTPTSASR